MALPLEDYALLSDCHSAALVGKNGSIDWLAFPCFDSPPFFAGLLGTDENGHWRISPMGEYQSTRSYQKDTLVLETVFKTPHGTCLLRDVLLAGEEHPTLVRSLEGLSGEVEMELRLAIRFDYGSIVPWVRRNRDNNGIHAIGGPEALVCYSPIPLSGRNMHTEAKFRVQSGERLDFSLIWWPSHKEIPNPFDDIESHIQRTIKKWQSWSGRCKYSGFESEAVKRSLLTIKALTYEPTGAILAAPTSSLPEEFGGSRNWDYRFSWIRDSSFALFALLKGGHKEEAQRWKDWLHRAVAGTPEQVNIMYGIRGERRLTEIELPWLAGYENSRPVRIGNKAYTQFQLDVYGEVLNTSNLGRKNGIPIEENSWRIEKHMVDFVCEHWQDPDEGIWEVRGPRRQFTHSKLMAWVALKSAVEAMENYRLPGDLEHWKSVRDRIHADICKNGFNQKLNSFVQFYGGDKLDASLLMMGHMGFLPANDPRMVGTVEAIKKFLLKDGLVLRYQHDQSLDGLPGQEGTFIPCSFWLVDNLRMMGRREEALELYRHLQTIKNDVGLFAEEFSGAHGRMLGNFPQALSHIAEAVSSMGFDDNQDLCMK